LKHTMRALRNECARNMRAIDTNVLVRLLARDDPKQVKAAENYIRGGAWISHLVLAEAMWVLEAVYNRNHNQLRSALKMLLQHKDLLIQEPNIVEQALGLFKNRKKVNFSDCLIYAIADGAGHRPLGTFDRAFARIDGVESI